jgi:6-phosphofructokinase
MAETAIPVNALDYVGENSVLPPEDRLSGDEEEAVRSFEEKRRRGQRIEGQTSDVLRRAALKMVLKGLKRELPSNRRPRITWDPLRDFSSEPRHLLRAIPPNTADLIMAQRLAVLAVDNAMAGYTDFMISHWLTEYVLVPLELTALGRKRIPESGMFWKSILAKTGQPASMVCGPCADKSSRSSAKHGP